MERANDKKKPNKREASGHQNAQQNRAMFRTIGLDEEPDQLQYRSMASMAAPAPPAFGNMHGAELMPHQLAMGMPTPLMMQGPGKAKTAPQYPRSESRAESTVRVDKTKYVGVTTRDLPALPFRLELHTHFHVKGEGVQRICSIVSRKLCELDTDFEFRAEKCKWKVDYRRQDSMQRVHLNIVIFKSGNEYVVEVQRREGDVTASMHLFSELKVFFKRNQLLCKRTPTATAGTKRPAPRSMPKIPVSADQVREAVASIKGLLESKFEDAQMQGVLAAISFSAGEDAGSAMAQLIPQLVTLGHSKNKNVAELAGVSLSRLCDHPDCRQALIRSDGWKFIVKCAAGGEDVKPEVQRESLHVVECLCPLYHDELAKVEGASKVLELVQGWQQIQDPRLKKHAKNAHKALQGAGVLA